MERAMSLEQTRNGRKESGLTYPCDAPPATGKAIELAPGILWMRMPLPFQLSHINIWAIKDSGGWGLVDTGISSTETAAAWRQLFAGVFSASVVTRVFVTHMHPDHIGMAGWLTRKFDCRLWISRLEYLNCRVLGADTGREAPDAGVRFYRMAGWDEDAIESYRTRFGAFGKMIYALPESYRRLQDKDEIEIGAHRWRVVIGSGHSPEHVCLYCPALKLLISGDQVLPRISSNVSVFPTEPDANPLADWLDSLRKLKCEVPNDVLVLPSHNEPFLGLHQRINALENSQLRALGRLRDALRQPLRAIDVFGALFSRPITSEHFLMSMATGESIAHLNYLIHRGEVSIKVAEDGVAWYQMLASVQGSPGTD
jgi:glyoxylase-like metal-dependent hydrolase (beta-lactamase superfamily II)